MTVTTAASPQQQPPPMGMGPTARSWPHGRLPTHRFCRLRDAARQPSRRATAAARRRQQRRGRRLRHNRPRAAAAQRGLIASLRRRPAPSGCPRLRRRRWEETTAPNSKAYLRWWWQKTLPPKLLPATLWMQRPPRLAGLSLFPTLSPPPLPKPSCLLTFTASRRPHRPRRRSQRRRRRSFFGAAAVMRIPLRTFALSSRHKLSPLPHPVHLLSPLLLCTPS